MLNKLQQSVDDMNSRLVDISVFPGRLTLETVVYSNLVYFWSRNTSLDSSSETFPPDLTSSLETVIYN